MGGDDKQGFFSRELVSVGGWYRAGGGRLAFDKHCSRFGLLLHALFYSDEIKQKITVHSFLFPS